MATAVSNRVLVSGPSMFRNKERECEECDKPIHPARLAKHPDTNLCARCQEQHGDVPTIRTSAAYQLVYADRPAFFEEREAPVAIFHTDIISDEPASTDGLAKNTGLHVRSNAAIQAPRGNGKKSWETRRANAAKRSA